MKETNNKGFSLVELVIVIAIMAVLVIVIAPQYTKFVKQSRVSADIQTASEMATAINVYIADPSTDLTAKPAFSADDTIAYANVTNVGAAPISKLNGVWKVYGNNTNGVTKITLTVSSVEYEAWPNSTDRGEGASEHGLEELNKPND